MLVLSRRRGEAIVIGDDIELIVLAVEAGRVRFGVKAPKDVLVYRSEVRERMNKETNEGRIER